MQIKLKVVSGASRNALAGWLGDALKVRVAAPPEHGKANAAVEKLIANTLGLPRRSVRIVAGASSPLKVAEIDGLDAAELQARLEALGLTRPF